ncbi:MAG: hypothetical protein KF795_01690 [Labilithrix sp.]|nr:hypothetical protein [Labilithrix sp.]
MLLSLAFFRRLRFLAVPVSLTAGIIGVDLVGLSVGTGCSSSTDPTPAADAGAAPQCLQQERQCSCSNISGLDGGAIDACTAESQGAEAVCCSNEQVCACFAAWNVVCKRSGNGLCTCDGDIYALKADEQPVAKCSPEQADGGATEVCCRTREPGAAGPRCVCGLGSCSQVEEQVAECGPAVVPSTCPKDAAQTATCEGHPITR